MIRKKIMDEDQIIITSRIEKIFPTYTSEKPHRYKLTIEAEGMEQSLQEILKYLFRKEINGK